MTPSDKRLEAGMEDMGPSQSQPCGASKHAATDLGTPVDGASDAELKRLAEALPYGFYAALTDDCGPVPHTNLVAFGPRTDCVLSLPGRDKREPLIEYLVASAPNRIISLLERLQAAEAAREDFDDLFREYSLTLAALSTSEASRLSVEGERDGLKAALAGFDDDYMTSEAHHPDYVLIPVAKFEAIRAALFASDNPTSVQAPATAPEPPWPIGAAANCKRRGWAAYFEGRGREDCPFPRTRSDLHLGYREGWDAAQASAPRSPLTGRGDAQ